jgi:hypothetical protein
VLGRICALCGLTITEQNSLAVSKKLADTSYAKMNGAKVQLPNEVGKHPLQIALQFHRTKVFR